MHAGGVLRDGSILSCNMTGVRAVYASKAYGSVNIEKVGFCSSKFKPLLAAVAQFSPCAALSLISRDINVLQEVINIQPLDQIVLFSSIASLTGPAGSATYAAANAVLDAAASSLTTTGIGSTAIQWGAWAEIGMVSNSHAVQQAMKRSGVGMVSPSSGLMVISTLISSQQSSPASVLAAIPFHWNTFMKLSRNKAASIYTKYLPETEETGPRLEGTGGATAKKPAFLPLQVLEKILQCIKSTQGTCIDANMPLIQAGVDSLGSECSG